MKQPPSKIQPDAPPAFRRALRLGWLEGIGVPALALLPALAIFGQLGPSTARTTASTLVGPDRVELSVVHPSVVRHRGLAELVVS
ncbi:MAG TPA: hypothetical protein VFY22_00075, partial [Hydrogenophaga sp.]|nr:hypothetical protein [Hydrogenophaga sp.]